MALTRRKVGKTTTKSTGTPKNKVEAPDPETYTEKGATNTAEKTQPLLGKCKKCATHVVYTLVTNLCFDCEMTHRGLEYDSKSNRFIKPKGRK